LNLSRLDADRERAGLKYEELRLKLISYFYRKQCMASDELADETLNRVARSIVEEEKILDEEPPVYCYRVARLVFLEYWSAPTLAQAALDKSNYRRRASHSPTRRNRPSERSDCAGGSICIHTGQAIVIAMLVVPAFRHLARVTQDARARRASGANL
jgi:hypothetical protein